MDNNESNIKSQQTGGLKLMTVFIAVLALHVVVIGGFTVYHLMSGGGTDTDLAGTDKTQKSQKATDGSAVTDGTLPPATQTDKSTPTPAPEVAATPATTPDNTASTATTAPTPAPAPTSTPTPAAAPVLTLTAPAPTLAPQVPPVEVVDEGPQAPTGPIASELAPPPDATPASLAAAPIAPAPLAVGPVHMPPATQSVPAHEHEQIYVVKITDSYKKIAHAHHITVAELKEANHIKGDVLHMGQKLIIPSTRTLVTESAPSSAPVLEPLATEPIASESAPAPVAELASAPSTVVTTTSAHHVYTVVKGDTLSKIAHKFKTTTTAIMTENDITDPSKLTIGKKLKIPSRESRSARNNPPASTQPGQVQAKGNAPTAQLANFVP